MSEQERLAREWAEYYEGDWPEFTPGTHAAELVEKAKAAAEYILATTTTPTMADVDWDHEKHHLAGAVFQNAVTDTTAEVVMFRKDGSGAIIAVDVENGQPFIGDASKYTPNGKKYRLVEEPGHPEVLETEEDYQNAPDATLAASMHGEGYIHNKTMSRWESTHGDWKNYAEMESSSPSGRRVLRWGWGGEA